MLRQAPNSQGVRPTRFYAVRNTYSDLHTTTIKDWLALYGDLGGYKGGGSEPPQQKLFFKLEDGTFVQSEIIFVALDRPDAVKKLRGSQVTGFWLNETKELSKPIVDMADLRHGRYPSMASGGIEPTWHGMIGDTNAPDEDHWYYKLAEEEKPKGWSFFRQPGGLIKQGKLYIENPNAENIRNLPPGYYMNGVAGKSEDWIKVNLCNEYGFVSHGKPVYPEYVDSVHCLEEDYIPILGLDCYIGLDFGRTPAAAFMQYNSAMGRYIAFDELVTEDMSATSFAPTLKEKIAREYSHLKFLIYGDPAGNQKGQQVDTQIFEILNSAGIPAIPTETNNTAVRRGAIINPMKRLCIDGRPAFLLSPKCKTLRKGMAGGFCYKRVQVAGDEKYKDEPDKNKYSHVCEAAEYALQGAGEGKLQDPVSVRNSMAGMPQKINNMDFIP